VLQKLKRSGLTTKALIVSLGGWLVRNAIRKVRLTFFGKRGDGLACRLEFYDMVFAEKILWM
jgi:hypothetical protein